MPLGSDAPTLWLLTLLLAVAAVLAILARAGISFRALHGRLSERFVFGVPWGTLVLVGWLFLVYLFVQRGWWHWHRPVIVAFTAVSMWDPTGWLLAGFSHVSPSHLRGNVTTTLVFAPIVEWIWGHYSDRRGRWRDRPLIRALVLFPIAIAGITVVATLFSWGPVIGFSVAAYALIGLALVHYPILAVVALVARQAVRLGWRAITDPVQISEATVRVVEPSWFGSAVQGHLVGLLLGVVVGLWLLDRRDAARPPTGRVFVAATVLGVALSLWAVWWILGTDVFILYRAAGVLVVLAVATTITLATSARTSALPFGRGAFAVLLIAVLAMGVVGVGLNVASADAPPEAPGVTVEDYRVVYAEDVPDGMVNVVDIEVLGLTTNVTTSGVIVVSEERNVWRRTVSAKELETHGFDRFYVGGLGWSTEVAADREGWVPLDSRPVYAVWLGVEGEYELAHESDARPVRAVLDNRTFDVRTDDGAFFVDVHFEDETTTVPIPDDGESVTAMGVELVRHGDQLFAVRNETVMPIASRETYD